MDEKSLWVDCLGNVYGPFRKQEDGFPNAGEVLRYYREKNHLTRPQLARQLNVTVRRIQNMEHDNQVFESITRRRALATLLGIPPALLGLASLDTVLRPMESTSAPAMAHNVVAPAIDTTTATQYAEHLQLSWNVYYTGSIQRTVPAIQQKIGTLTTLIPQARGGVQDQLIESACGYYDILARVGADQDDPTSAVMYLNAALDLTSPQNVELLSRLLYKRGMVQYEYGEYGAARTSLEEAESLAKKLRPEGAALAGSIILQKALVLSRTAKDYTDTKTSLQLFERAGSIARMSPVYEGVRLDEGRFLCAYADGLISLGRLQEAEDILDEATEKTNSAFTKRLALIDAQRVRLLLRNRERGVAQVLAEDLMQRGKSLGSIYLQKQAKMAL